MKKKIFIFMIILLAIFVGVFFFYFNNTQLVNPKTRVFYKALKDTLKQKGFSPRLLVISTKRAKWQNEILVEKNGAAKESRHLVGEAIDFIVFDINGDGNSDSKDVDIVFNILDKNIIKSEGGIGTYKDEKSFFNKQMVHIDCRGYKARW